jgi:formate hydrogenlyase subunit 6/NADH:ubiquinone oxidoreductase subunit I/coenzyme F420-reducing hydrogenase delta subunit
MVVEVSCIGIITPLILLKTLALGAEGTALIPCQNECRLGYNLKKIHENLQASKRFLEILKTNSERICVISPSTNLREFHTQLKAYSQNIARLGSHSLFLEKFSEAENSWQSLPFLLKRIVDELKLDKDFKVHSSELPFGVVEAKTDVCSMCGLCARRCPTDALSFDMNSEEAKLVFNYNLCIACGICLEICPSKALQITKMLNLKRLTVPLTVLVKDKMVKCRSCGVAFQPSKQVRYISSKVSMKEKYLKLVSKYCPNCRGRHLPPTFDTETSA